MDAKKKMHAMAQQQQQYKNLFLDVIDIHQNLKLIDGINVAIHNAVHTKWMHALLYCLHVKLHKRKIYIGNQHHHHHLYCPKMQLQRNALCSTFVRIQLSFCFVSLYAFNQTES